MKIKWTALGRRIAASYLNSTLLPHERDEVIASVREDRCRLRTCRPSGSWEGSQSLRRLLAQAASVLSRSM